MLGEALTALVLVKARQHAVAAAMVQALLFAMMVYNVFILCRCFVAVVVSSATGDGSVVACLLRELLPFTLLLLLSAVAVALLSICHER